MSKTRITDSVIIILVWSLLVFHTCTFLQIYYNYFTTLAVFTVVLFLCLIKNGGRIKVKTHSGMALLLAIVAVMIVVGTLIKDKELTYMVGGYLPYVIWPILFFVTEPLMDGKGKRTFLLLFTITLSVSLIATLSVLIADHEAARLLAGVARGSVREAYYRRGVGGYGFVYGCVFIVFGLIMWISREDNTVVKAWLWIVVALLVVTVLFSSYTIALLMMMVVLLLSVYSRSKKRQATIMLLIVSLVVFLLIGPLLTAVHNLADNLGLEWVVKRTTQLLNARETGDWLELKRIRLYQKSWNAFKENIWLGGGYDGGHSMVFDHLAQYGLIGGLFCFAFFRWLNKFGKNGGIRTRLIYWVLIVLLFINTTDTIVMFPMILYVLPLMIQSEREKGGLNEKSVNNKLFQFNKYRR